MQFIFDFTLLLCIDTISHNNLMFDPFTISNWFEITKIILMLNQVNMEIYKRMNVVEGIVIKKLPNLIKYVLLPSWWL